MSTRLLDNPLAAPTLPLLPRLMFFLSGLVLICTQAVLGDEGLDKCCFPYKIQGKKFFIEELRSADFAIDFEAMRAFESDTPDRKMFHVLDLASGTRNMFTGTECRTEPYPNVDLYNRCIYDRLEIPDLTLGQDDEGHRVNMFGYQANNVTRVSALTRRGANCYPVYVHDYFKATKRTENVLHSEVTPTVTGYNSNMLYADLTDCRPASVS